MDNRSQIRFIITCEVQRSLLQCTSTASNRESSSDKGELEPQVQRLLCDLPPAAVQRLGRVLAGAKQRLGAVGTRAAASCQSTGGQQERKHDHQIRVSRLRQTSPLFLQSGTGR